MIKISKDDFLAAAAKTGITNTQQENLWSLLESRKAETQAEDSVDSSTSSYVKWLSYFGAMIIISAMTWLMTLGWERFGDLGLLLISLGYAIFFFLIGNYLWKQRDLHTPGGLLITVAISMTPLILYALGSLLGWWSNDPESYRDFYSLIKVKWVVLEVGTILVGTLALYFYPFPFLTLPIYYSAWFLSMDTISFIKGNEVSFDELEWDSMIFGVVILAIGYFLDRKKESMYGFWAYLFGTITFWGGLSILSWDRGEVIAFLYFIINLAMMIASIFLKRKVLMVFGAIGTFIYLSHLSYDFFKDSMLFPFALSFLGLLVIYLGIVFQRNEAKIESKLHDWISKGGVK